MAGPTTEPRRGPDSRPASGSLRLAIYAESKRGLEFRVEPSTPPTGEDD